MLIRAGCNCYSKVGIVYIKLGWFLILLKLVYKV